MLVRRISSNVWTVTLTGAQYLDAIQHGPMDVDVDVDIVVQKKRASVNEDVVMTYDFGTVPIKIVMNELSSFVPTSLSWFAYMVPIETALEPCRFNVSCVNGDLYVPYEYDGVPSSTSDQIQVGLPQVFGPCKPGPMQLQQIKDRFCSTSKIYQIVGEYGDPSRNLDPYMYVSTRVKLPRSDFRNYQVDSELESFMVRNNLKTALFDDLWLTYMMSVAKRGNVCFLRMQDDVLTNTGLKCTIRGKEAFFAQYKTVSESEKERIRNDLENCLLNNRKVIIPVSILYEEGGGHKNAIVLDPIHKIASYFEPHGESCAEDLRGRTAFEELIRTDPTYESVRDYSLEQYDINTMPCLYGIQSKLSWAKLDRGYCVYVTMLNILVFLMSDTMTFDEVKLELRKLPAILVYYLLLELVGNFRSWLRLSFAEFYIQNKNKISGLTTPQTFEDLLTMDASVSQAKDILKMQAYCLQAIDKGAV